MLIVVQLRLISICTSKEYSIKLSFDEKLYYQFIKILNVHGSMLFERKVQHLFFYAIKTFVKYEILNNYVDRCYILPVFACFELRDTRSRYVHSNLQGTLNFDHVKQLIS